MTARARAVHGPCYVTTASATRVYVTFERVGVHRWDDFSFSLFQREFRIISGILRFLQNQSINSVSEHTLVSQNLRKSGT